MDGLKMMTVLGSFQGNGGGGGADLSHGGTIGGDLRVNGDLSACGNIAANTMHANELTAGTGAFESLSVGGQSISDLISGGGSSTQQEEQGWQPLLETDAIRNGGRYFVRGNSSVFVNMADYQVCSYAQAEIALLNTNSALDILWPSHWLWAVGSDYQSVDYGPYLKDGNA